VAKAGWPDLAGLARVHPSLNEVDLLGWPSAVTGHRAGANPSNYGTGVCADIIIGPEIKMGLHGRSVARAKEGLYLMVEAHKIALSGSVGHEYHRPLCGSSLVIVGADALPEFFGGTDVTAARWAPA
jgi:hypothetical protein